MIGDILLGAKKGGDKMKTRIILLLLLASFVLFAWLSPNTRLSAQEEILDNSYFMNSMNRERKEIGFFALSSGIELLTFILR